MIASRRWKLLTTAFSPACPPVARAIFAALGQFLAQCPSPNSHALLGFYHTSSMQALRVRNAGEVLDLLGRSERMFTDLTLSELNMIAGGFGNDARAAQMRPTCHPHLGVPALL